MKIEKIRKLYVQRLEAALFIRSCGSHIHITNKENILNVFREVVKTCGNQ